MSRLILSLSLGLLLLPVLYAQGEGPARPVLVSGAWDFGEKEQGEKDEYRIEIRNEAGTPLGLTFAKVTCGCLSAEVLDREIAPGKTGAVLVRLDSSRQQGEIRKHVYVGTNDLKHPHLSFEVSGFVHARVRLEPAHLQLGVVDIEDDKTYLQEVFVREGLDIKLLEVNFALPDMLSVEIETFGETKGKHGYRLRYRPLPGLPRGQRIQVPVQLKLEDKEVPTLTTSVLVETQGLLKLSPESVDFGEVVAGEEAVLEIHVETRNGADFKLVSARALDPKIEVKIIKSEAGPRHKIVLRRPGGDRHVKPITSRLYIVTDLKEQTMMQVPIVGQIIAAPKKN